MVIGYERFLIIQSLTPIATSFLKNSLYLINTCESTVFCSSRKMCLTSRHLSTRRTFQATGPTGTEAS